MKIYLGTTDWNYDDWRGTFYPQSLTKAEFLNYYSQEFNTAEIASTYYRLPFYNHVRKWNENTPNDFRFAMKLIWQTTHQNRMEPDEPNKAVIEGFFKRMQDIGDKISLIVIQPPNDLEFDPEKIRKFVSLLPGDFRYALEIKNPDWQNDEYLAFCAETGLIPVSYSSAKGDYFPRHPGIRDAFFRFCGKMPDSNYLYPDSELSEYSDKIQDSRYDTVWVYFSNTIKHFAIENAKTMKRLLQA